MPKGQPRVPKALTVEWETPPDLFDQLWDEFGGFDLDPACRPEQRTAQQVLKAGGTIYCPLDEDVSSRTTERIFNDGLDHDWNCRMFFCNPPYGLALRQWVPYALDQVRHGHAGGGVMLVPATTDTIWWQDNVVSNITQNDSDMHYLIKELRFVRARLTFSGMPAPADKGSALLIMGRTA